MEKLTGIVRKTTPDAKINYQIFDKELNVGYAIIEIETDKIIVKDVRQFVKSIEHAANFEIYPLTNGNIKIGITFHNMSNIMPECQGGSETS